VRILRTVGRSRNRLTRHDKILTKFNKGEKRKIISSWSKVQNAATTNELKKAIIEELHLRAWQERTSATIGRTTKTKRAAAEHAAFALEILAQHLTDIEPKTNLSK
jgi:hypothetical protein